MMQDVHGKLIQDYHGTAAFAKNETLFTSQTGLKFKEEII